MARLFQTKSIVSTKQEVDYQTLISEGKNIFLVTQITLNNKRRKNIKECATILNSEISKTQSINQRVLYNTKATIKNVTGAKRVVQLHPFRGQTYSTK